MKNELLITELKHECDDFANKLMDMFKGVRVEFTVYDENERFQDAMKDNQKGEWMEQVILHRKEKAVSFNPDDNTIRFHKLYYTITELEETLKQAKELINGK